MFELVIGIIVGISVSMVGVLFILGTGSVPDIQIIVAVATVVIAAATVIAAYIHHSSIEQQRKDRVWEINKDNLLKLSKAVSDSIIISEEISESTFNDSQGIIDLTDKTSIEAKKEIKEKFQETMLDSLNVYKPLLNSELIIAIEKYQMQEEGIRIGFDGDAYTTYEACDLHLAILKELHAVICAFIKDVSGIDT